VRSIAWGLALCIGFLHAANLARIVIHSQTGHGNLWGLLPLFHVDREGNIPTFYSVVTLMVAALLGAIVAARERRAGEVYWKHWAGISAVFGWLSVDEGCHIHEFAIPIGHMVGARGLFFFAWVIPALVILGMLTVVYFRMIFSLPRWFRNRAILSAAVFIFGALGLEMIGGHIAEKFGMGIVYQMVCGLEELLEMTGVALWICALLRYLATSSPPVVVSVDFSGRKSDG
jgi:hypothetical protein